MAFQLNGKILPTGVAFTTSDGTQYPSNWLNLSSAEEKTAIGITEVEDPKVYDPKFYYEDGTAKVLDDVDSKDDFGNLIKNEDGTQHITYGLKTILKNEEKDIASSLLAKYDWYVIRKQEKGIEIPTAISTYRDAIRTACSTRETEIDNCSDITALVTLYQSTEKDNKFIPNMTQYPKDPNIQEPREILAE